MQALIELWTKTLGETPPQEQFEVWSALYVPEVVRRGIIKTAEKNLNLGRTMTQDHKIRFASKVMAVWVRELGTRGKAAERVEVEVNGNK